jgi:hypothetical protein
MKAKGKKPGIAAVVPSEVSGDDRTALTAAYKAGLIQAWKRDVEHGYCLTVASRPDAYVEVDRLRKYLEELKAS